jgi:antitoxin YefM
MHAISYTKARANLSGTMEKVCTDHDPVIITRSSSASVVMLSLEDFESLKETAYLLRTPMNTRRLLDSIEQLEAGKGTVREIAE